MAITRADTLNLTSVAGVTSLSGNLGDGSATSNTHDKGDLIQVHIGVDNAAAGGTSPVSSVVDSAGHVYVEVATVTRSPGGAANDGTTLSVWEARCHTAMTASDTITVNFSTSVGAVVVRACKWSGTKGTWSDVHTGSGTGTGVTAITTASVPSGDAVEALACVETTDTVTGDSDTSNGSWAGISNRIANTGTSATSQRLVRQQKVVTGTGTQTWSCTWTNSTDYAAIVFQIQAGAFCDALAGVASASATANGATGSVAPSAGVASATATAHAAKVGVAPQAGVASVATTAHDATVLVSGSSATAQVASATATASTAQVSVAPTAQVAIALVTAHDARTAVAPTAEPALSSATAHNVSTSASIVKVRIGDAWVEAVVWIRVGGAWVSATPLARIDDSWAAA